MGKEILVSIVLPVLAGTGAALDRTVRAVLGQTEPCWQLHLVESAATRGMAQHWVGVDARIQVLQHAGDGRAAALRAGLLQCHSTYTVFLDTEHVWHPDFLARTTAFLCDHPLADLVCMGVGALAGRSMASVHQGELLRHLRWGGFTRLAVTLLRTDCAQWLAPALNQETEALDYRLQARLAAQREVGLLALSGVAHHPIVGSPVQQQQREIDALAVFDEIHGRRWETDADIARLRRARMVRIDRIGLRVRLQAQMEQCRAWACVCHWCIETAASCWGYSVGARSRGFSRRTGSVTGSVV